MQDNQAFDLCDSTDLMIWLFSDLEPSNQNQPDGARPVTLPATPLELAPTIRIGDVSDPSQLIDCDVSELHLPPPPSPVTARLHALRPSDHAGDGDDWRGPTIAWLSSLLVVGAVLGLAIAL